VALLSNLMHLQQVGPELLIDIAEPVVRTDIQLLQAVQGLSPLEFHSEAVLI